MVVLLRSGLGGQHQQPGEEVVVVVVVVARICAHGLPRGLGGAVQGRGDSA